MIVVTPRRFCAQQASSDCVQTGRATVIPGEEGLRDVRIMEAIYRSAAEGKTVRLA